MADNPRPHPVDRYVGARLHLRRKTQGLSLNEVATAVGVTFQQLQKYERGVNRVSASRLHRLAQALKAPTAWFFDGLAHAEVRNPGSNADEDNRRSAMLIDLLTTPEGIELSQLFCRIQPRQRLQILALAKLLVEDEAKPLPSA